MLSVWGTLSHMTWLEFAARPIAELCGNDRDSLTFISERWFVNGRCNQAIQRAGKTCKLREGLWTGFRVSVAQLKRETAMYSVQCYI